MMYENIDSLVRLWFYFSLTDSYYSDGNRSSVKQNFQLMQISLSELGIEDNEIQNKFFKPLLNDFDNELKNFKNNNDNIHIKKIYKIYCKKMNIYLEISSTISLSKNTGYDIDCSIEKI